MQIDALNCVCDYWGEGVLRNRDLTYKLASGNCPDKLYRRLLMSYYQKNHSFANYVDDVVLFGDRSTPLITRLIKPIRDTINKNIDKIVEQVKTSGGKLVMISNDYVYAIYKHDNYPEFDKMRVIE